MVCVRPLQVPSEPASMHELHHRANRVASEALASNLFAVPLIPAIVFSEWGDPFSETLLKEDELGPGTAGGARVCER